VIPRHPFALGASSRSDRCRPQRQTLLLPPEASRRKYALVVAEGLNQHRITSAGVRTAADDMTRPRIDGFRENFERGNVKNKPPLNEDEKIRIEALSANGATPSRIGRDLQRSHHTIQGHLGKPETQARVQDAKQILAKRYEEEARRILDSITPEDITKASLLQKTTSSAICTDKSLALSGQSLSIDVHILLEAVRVVREMREQPQPVLVEGKPEP